MPIAEVRKQLAATVRAAREKANVTQAEMASKLGVELRSYQRFETGNLSLERVVEIADALHVPVASLFDTKRR